MTRAGFSFINLHFINHFLKRVIALLQVVVKDGNVDYAIKSLRRKMQREGVFRTVKNKRYFETKSEEKKRKHEENCKRRKKFFKVIEV